MMIVLGNVKELVFTVSVNELFIVFFKVQLNLLERGVIWPKGMTVAE